MPELIHSQKRKKWRSAGMQIEAAMGRVAMQVERHAHEGDLHHQERHEHVAPEAKIQNSVEKI